MNTPLEQLDDLHVQHATLEYYDVILEIEGLGSCEYPSIVIYVDPDCWIGGHLHCEVKTCNAAGETIQRWLLTGITVSPSRIAGKRVP